MKLKQNSWYAWYYRTFYNTNKLPISLCKFFWMEIVAILLFLPLYPVIILNLITNDKEDYDKMPNSMRFMLSGLINMFSICLGSGIIHNFINLKSLSDWNLIWISPLGLILMITGVAILIGSIFLIGNFCDWIYKRYKSWRNSNIEYATPKEPNNWFKEGIKAFFNRYCPRIEWIKESN